MCNERLRELDMCAHEIKVRGGFESSYFLDRHFCRQSVRGSLVGWNASENDFIAGLIGFEYEEIESDRIRYPQWNRLKTMTSSTSLPLQCYQQNRVVV